MGETAQRQCPQCGAQVELPVGRLADACSFCETPLVDATGAAERVDLVVPFDLDRERASGRLRGFVQGQWWAPEALRRAASPDRVHGVLVPFYVYDGVARSRYTGRVGLHWYRTETYTVTVNGRTETRTRRVQETEWFDVRGSHAATYTRQLVSGSRGLPEAEANQLEPFDLGRALPFDPALTAGWVAELPDVDHAEAERQVANEVAERENAAIRGAFLPGDTRAGVQNTTELSIEGVQLALLPVWIATYRWQGQVFRLLVNGQTGEVVGRVPRSPWKIGCAVAALVGAIVLFATLMLLCAGLGSRAR